MPPSKSSFKEREDQLLRELSGLYSKLNSVRQQREHVDMPDPQRSTSDAAADEEGRPRRRRRVILVTRSLPFKLTPSSGDSASNTASTESTDGAAGASTSTSSVGTTQWRAEFSDTVNLDSAMETYRNIHDSYDCVWIGSVHGDVEASDQNNLKEQLLHERKYYPVFLDDKKEKLFYQGYCKTLMWPIYHSIPPTSDDQLQTLDLDVGGTDDEDTTEKMWQAYQSVNQSFADAIRDVYEEGDIVWIQGYHLSLVPQMVRSLFPNTNVPVGFFMHIPFPSSELYRVLSNREEIMTGMLGADLLGFQTYEFARHFQSCTIRLLGLESSHKGVDFNGHFTRITICPVGIDAKRLKSLVASDGVQENVRQLRQQFAGKRLILGVDPLDQTKGLLHKLLAVEEMFTANPELAKETIFLQIVSSPASIFDSSLGSQVESLVSRINSKLQDLGADGPVQYLNKEIPMDSLLALFCVADTLASTPLRDGMNTIPLEYVVCREVSKECSRVVLSEFAGCAHSLGGATLTNPWNTEQLAGALKRTAEDSDDIQRAHRNMYDYVTTFTSQRWGDNFLEQLRECSDENASAVSGRELSRRDMTSAYVRSGRRMVFINYEGVLAADASIPELSYPPQELLWQLSMLTKDPRNIVVLISARSMNVCDQWFAELQGSVVLAAEYGVYVKWLGDNQSWHCTVPNLDLSWWQAVVPLLEYYTERTPGAFIERKDSSATWHYRDCDLDHGAWQASELLISLRELTRALPVSVVPGPRCLEVRPQKLSKAALFDKIWEFANHASSHHGEMPDPEIFFGEKVSRATSTASKDKDALPTDLQSSKPQESVDMSSQSVDFVLVIASGDDRTDEDLFSHLVPPPLDLEAYCRQLEQEEQSGSSHRRTGSNPRVLTSSDKSRLPSSLERLAPTGADADLLDQQNVAKSLNPSVKYATKGNASVPHSAASKFPKTMLSSSTNARRDEITEKSKFTPRRDFPPTAALFKALRTKYGENFDMRRVPDTPAAAWALVVPPQARARLEDSTESEVEAKETSKEEEASTKYKFPVNTFVCTLGRKLSQAPYYIKNSADLFQLLQEMGLNSHLHKQRMMSTSDNTTDSLQ